MKDQEEERFKILFLIVTWNRKETLSQCLSSVEKYVPFPHKILVIDNASSDGTPDMVRTEFPKVDLIVNSKNEGFSKANNQGIMYLREHKIQIDYVIFFNDDARWEDSSLQPLIDFLDENQEVKACIPSVFVSQEKLQAGVGGYELSLLSAFYYFSFLSVIFPSLFKGFFIHQKYYRDRGLISEVDWISGVCFVLRGDMALWIKFDEQFFMYAEDIALCRDIREHGKIVYFPFSRVLHQMKSYSPGKGGTLWLDSLFQYYREQTHIGRPKKLWLLKIIFVYGFLLRALGYGILAVFKKNNYRDKRKELLSYCRHIMRGFFG
jgi:GT2 family glycosyltransferase